jgi:hypothetical protein
MILMAGIKNKKNLKIIFLKFNLFYIFILF